LDKNLRFSLGSGTCRPILRSCTPAGYAVACGDMRNDWILALRGRSAPLFL